MMSFATESFSLLFSQANLNFKTVAYQELFSVVKLLASLHE